MHKSLSIGCGSTVCWEVNYLLYADDMVLMAGSREKLHKLMTEFGRMYESRVLSKCEQK